MLPWRRRDSATLFGFHTSVILPSTTLKISMLEIVFAAPLASSMRKSQTSVTYGPSQT